MIYSQFQQSPFQTRFSGTRGWMAFAIGLVVITLTLIALPFVLLLGAISFILLSLFGRIFMKRQLARFRQQQSQATQQSSFSEPTEGQDQAEFERTRFGSNRHQAKPHHGRTFDHDPS
ncbi:MAG: ABC-type nickel/cobalt efflux system permease component RcnA [Shewanella sp.]|jgi:ABC-type nickel/cobalt efflux system permease component RcnA